MEEITLKDGTTLKVYTREDFLNAMHQKFPNGVIIIGPPFSWADLYFQPKEKQPHIQTKGIIMIPFPL